MRLKKIEIPIFKVNVILLDGEIEDAIAYIEADTNQKLDAKDLEDADALTFFHRGFAYVCWEKNIRYETLAHEALHVVLDACKWLGINNDDEVLCYLLEYILQEALGFMEKGKQ